MDRGWMYLADRTSKEFKEGVDSFLERCDDSPCPCRQCNNARMNYRDRIEKHLYRHGFTANYKRWIYHGEELVKDTDRDEGISVTTRGTLPSFLEDCSKPEPDNSKGSIRIESPLFPGEEKMRVLELSAKLLRLKAENGWSHESFGSMIQFLRSSFPAGGVGNLPDSVEGAKEFLRELGFGYELIHSCRYDCALFWKENSSLNKCPICEEPRFKYEDESTGEKIPQKVMYYFPLKPRLQRLFMCEETANDMRWHKEKRLEVKDLMSHPADCPQWKRFDEDYPWFARDCRNVRLGLATKGFKASSDSSSMWPVTLVPYNLPPKKCTSGEFFMLTMLVPGSKSPGLDIDVYLKPLITELKELWSNGVETYDASTRENFRLYASLLWTISDFPMYESLSGWCLRGQFSCPNCHIETSKLDLKGGENLGVRPRKAYLGHRRFLPPDHPWRQREDYRKNWAPETREPPILQSGELLLHQLNNVDGPMQGKHPKRVVKRKLQLSTNNWMLKSVFFELEYWHNLAIRHNIDIMYIEQSLCDNIIGTLLDIQGMSKDSKIDRLDLAHLNIRSELHFTVYRNDLVKPPACYTVPKHKRSQFCAFFKFARLPDFYGIDFSKKANFKENKLGRLNAHECHIVLQRLLPIATLEFIRKDIVTTFSELATFFQQMCAKTLRASDLERLQERVAFIYCKLEKIYPPSFFDIMTHSALHLPFHAKLAGPVEFRSIYPFERYMEMYGKYVTKRARPEESIAEAYSANEVLRFCSMNLCSGAEKKSNREEEEKRTCFSVFSQNAQPFKQRECSNLSERELGRIQSHVLRNCKEIEHYLKKYKEEEGDDYDEEENDEDDFPSWFEKRINQLRKTEAKKVEQELHSLSTGPDCRVSHFSGCIVDGIRFLVQDEDDDRITSNCGVYWLNESNGKKEDFFGKVKNVLEVKYKFGFRVILFKCKQFQRQFLTMECNISHVKGCPTGELFDQRESYILASQAKMLFLSHSMFGNRYFMQKFEPRLFWDVFSTVGDSSDAVAKPENCNFVWTENVGDIQHGHLLCEQSPAEVMSADVLPISGNEIDDVTEKSMVFEGLWDDYATSLDLSGDSEFEDNDDDGDNDDNEDNSFSSGSTRRSSVQLPAERSTFT